MQVNSARKSTDQKITQVIQTYANRINQVHQALSCQAADVQILENELQQQQCELKNILNECKRTLEGL